MALVSVDGEQPYGWFPAAALAPASAPAETPSPLPEETVDVPSTTALAVPPEGVSQGALDPRHAPRNFHDGEPTPVTLSTAEESTRTCSR